MPTRDAGRNNAGYSPSSLIKCGETACGSGRSFLRFLVSYGLRFLVSFFLCREILFTQSNPVFETSGSQPFHVLIHFRVRDLRVNLRGGNGGMSHHAAYRLYRNTERKSDVGSVIMPGLVEGQIKSIYPA